MPFSNQQKTTRSRFGFSFDRVYQDNSSPYIAYYPESNQDGIISLYGGGSFIVYGETFTIATTKTISKIRFYIKKLGAPVGDMIFGLWSTNGTIPVASLAESAAVDADSTLTTSLQVIELDLGTPYEASAGTYAVVCYFADGDASNCVQIGNDSTPSYAGGHAVASANAVAWSSSTAYDTIFYVL